MLEYIVLLILILLFLFPIKLLICSQFSKVNIHYKNTFKVLFAIQNNKICTDQVKSQIAQSTIQNPSGYNVSIQFPNSYILYYSS